MRDTLLFDLDGTLLDTIDDLATAVNHALTLHGYPTHSRTDILAMVGNGIASLMARALPMGKDTPDFDAVFADFRAYYEVHKTDLTAPYAGVTEMLSGLSSAGYHIAIVSNKVDSAVRALAARYFGSTVAVAIGERDGVARKPAPDMINAALCALGSTADRAFMIGDSEVDVETARNAGIPCLAVTWGFRTEAALRAAGATTLFHTAAELTEYLKKG